MANFSSSFISTANIGSWDYYIFSDNIGIWRSLNGLAAWFNGSGPMLQGAAWLGALIVLCIALFEASIKKSTISGGILGTWFFFMSMMGITGQANIYNIYTNQVTVVQNIPALALVPASVFSKAAYKVFVSMDTAFQAVSGSYMSISQFGFVGPLDLLLSLRSPRMTAANPALSQTLTQVVHDCALDPNATASTPPISNDLDMLNWLTVYGRPTGVTRVYTESDASGQGIQMACKNGPSDPNETIDNASYSGALDYINKQYEVLASGSNTLMKFVNAETTKKNPQDTNGLWNSTSLQGSFDMLIDSAKGMHQNAVQFTKNALVASAITYTMDCLSQSGAMTTPETCASGALALGDSMETWKTNAAMAGSGFLKTMFTSMGVLQALFFALFPVIAIYGLVVPMKTGQVFGGFIFFGIWCQSWLLVVAPVQAYIQTSVIDQMSSIVSGDGGMTLANSMAVYQALSTKLAIAADIMASSQMLSLALLSGSMVALSGLAGKWSGEKHMDPSKLQHDLSKSAPLVDNKPMNAVSSISDSNGHLTSVNNKVGSGAYQLQSSYIQNAMQGHSTDTTSSQDKSRATETALTKQLMSQFNMEEGNAASLAKTLTTMDSLNAKVGAGIATALGGGIAAAVTKLSGKTLTDGEKAKMAAPIGKAQETAISQLATKDPSFLSKLMGKDGTDAQAEAAGTVVDVAAGILTVGALAAETFSIAGIAAGPATATAMVAATAVAKASVMSRIKSGATTVAEAGAIAATNSLTKQPGGIAAAAKALTGDTSAFYAAAIQNAMKSDSTTSAKKGVSKAKTFTASDVDKFSKSWRQSQSESSTRSDSNGQTRTASVSLDQAQIMRAAVDGIGEGDEHIDGNTLQTRASENSALLRSLKSPEAVAAADREVAVATNGRTAQDFGGGEKGRQIAAYEKNVLFEHFLTGQVNGSMMNSKAGAVLGGSVATQAVQPTGTTAGHWEKIGKGQPGATDISESTALRDWGTVDGAAPAMAAAGMKAGVRWVPGNTHAAASPVASALSAGGRATASQAKGAPLAPAEEKKVEMAATRAETAAIRQLAGSDKDFLSQLSGEKGVEVQDAAVGKVVSTASEILANSISSGQVVTGSVGSRAQPASMGAQIANTANAQLARTATYGQARPSGSNSVSSRVASALSAGGIAAAALVKGDALTPAEVERVDVAAKGAESVAISQLSGSNMHFASQLEGTDGINAQNSATTQVLLRASGILADSLGSGRVVRLGVGPRVSTAAMSANITNTAQAQMARVEATGKNSAESQRAPSTVVSASIAGGKSVAAPATGMALTSGIALVARASDQTVKMNVSSNNLGQDLGKPDEAKTEAFIKGADKENQISYNKLKPAAETVVQFNPALAAEIAADKVEKGTIIGAVAATAVVGKAVQAVAGIVGDRSIQVTPTAPTGTAPGVSPGAVPAQPRVPINRRTVRARG